MVLYNPSFRDSDSESSSSGEEVQWAFLELDPIPEEEHDPLAITHDYQLLHAYKGIKYYQSLGCLKNTQRSQHSITYSYTKVLSELISCVFLVSNHIRTKHSVWPRDIVVQPDCLLSGLKRTVPFSSSLFCRGKRRGRGSRPVSAIMSDDDLLTGLSKRKERPSVRSVDWGESKSASRQSLQADVTFSERQGKRHVGSMQGSTDGHIMHVAHLAYIEYFLPERYAVCTLSVCYLLNNFVYTQNYCTLNVSKYSFSK